MKDSVEVWSVPGKDVRFWGVVDFKSPVCETKCIVIDPHLVFASDFVAVREMADVLPRTKLFKLINS